MRAEREEGKEAKGGTQPNLHIIHKGARTRAGTPILPICAITLPLQILQVAQ